MNAHEPMTAWQQDLLARFREQQEAYLEAVIAWRKSFEAQGMGGAAPTPPAAPIFDPAVAATEAFEANRAFTEAAFKQQQEFLEKLTRALGSGT